MNSSNITKRQLEELYFTQNLNQREIAARLGYADYRSVIRAFKKFRIPAKSRQEVAAAWRFTLPKAQLLADLEVRSASSVAQQYGVNLVTILREMRRHGIKTTYFKNELDDGAIELVRTNHLYDVAEHYNVAVGVLSAWLKRRSVQLSPITMTREDIIKLVNKLGNNKGLVKQLSVADPRIKDNIFNLTKDHTLTSTKMTERIYRIIHDWSCDQVPTCRFCNTPLRFYTLESGYGLDHGICKKCLHRHCGIGVSGISQTLFDTIVSHLQPDVRHLAEYYNQGGERHVTIDPVKRLQVSAPELLNKLSYRLDFVLGNRVIEFDGEYWHKDPSRDKVRDEYLKLEGLQIMRITSAEYSNSPQQVIQRCINFLTQ